MKKYIIAGRRVEMEPEGRTAIQAEKYRADFEESAEIKCATGGLNENKFVKILAVYCPGPL